MNENYFVKNTFVYFLIFLVSITFAQKPFSKENPNNTIALKGCAYINLLDGGFGSIFGVEKGFLKNHSIGTKFIYNYFTPHTEIKNDEGNYVPADYTNNRDLSFILEYKYYCDFKFLKEKDASPYISLSYKTSKNTIDKDYKYPHDYYHQKINYNYFGPALGCSIVMDNNNRWTIDTQLGYLFGQKKLSTDYVVPNEFNVRESYNTTMFRFEIMLAYNIN
jgi:hypothetical protein